MSQAEIAALLGRPLTSTEVTNFDLYLDTAYEKLETYLCYSICKKSGTRKFKAREMSTLFTGVFSNVTRVKINGDETEDFTPQLWDDLNSSWYNSLVFDDRLERGDTVEVLAVWGFSKLPKDLGQFLAKTFAMVSSGVYGDQRIQSKQVEDFRVTYADQDKSAEERLLLDYASVVHKYGICGIGEVRSGGDCDSL